MTTAQDTADWFEITEEYVYSYSYSYGGVSPFFREIVHNQRLMVTRCDGCGLAYCPPRPDCQACWQPTRWEPHGGQGTVLAAVYCYWTQINAAVRRYVQPPFVYALVQLDGVSNALHALVHADDMRLNVAVRRGTRVTVRFRESRTGSMGDLYFVPGDAP